MRAPSKGLALSEFTICVQVGHGLSTTLFSAQGDDDRRPNRAELACRTPSGYKVVAPHPRAGIMFGRATGNPGFSLLVSKPL
jgi:hypothetical protein